MTAGILILTAGLFFILPRTANAALHLLASNRYHLTGFSNDVMLGEVGELKSDSRPVLHVKPLSINGIAKPAALPLNLKWRGLALERFDGHRWSTDPASFRPVLERESGLVSVADEWQRRRRGQRALYRVEIQNVDADALFAAGVPEYLNIGPARVSRAPSGAFRFGFVPADTLRYEVYSFIGPETGPPEPHRFRLTVTEREQNLLLPPLDPRIAELARQMTLGATDDLTRARDIETRLRHDYAYSLDLPSIEVRDPVSNFLFVRKRGYCEYFASAMTVMLRGLGIPARLVNGFQSGVANPYSGTVVIRASDAHTWVEAFLPETGWTVFDPTPAGAPSQQNLWTTFALYMDAADTFWRDWVLSYDLGRQISLASGVASAWVPDERLVRESAMACGRCRASGILGLSTWSFVDRVGGRYSVGRVWRGPVAALETESRGPAGAVGAQRRHHVLFAHAAHHEAARVSKACLVHAAGVRRQRALRRRRGPRSVHCRLLRPAIWRQAGSREKNGGRVG